MEKKIKLFKKQQLAFQYLRDKFTNIVVYAGSAGSAKSFLGCVWLISNCIEYPGTNWAMCRNYHTTLYNTTFRTFLKVAKMVGLETFYTVNKSLGQIVFKNGSTIFLIHTEDSPSDPEFTRFGGTEFTGIYIDEAELSRDAFEVLTGSRIRHMLTEYNLIPKILITTNPQNNWMYDEFYIKYKNDCLPEYVKFITTTTNDNPSLPESYVEGLKRLPSPKFERLYLGLWEYSESDIFFDRLSLNDIFNKNLIYNKNKYISCDVAGEGRDMSIILIWQDYKVIDYYKEDKTNLMDLVTKIKSYMTKYNIKASNVVVDNQGIGAVVGQNIIGCHRFAANNKAIDEAYSDIRSECIFKMRELFSMIDISILSQYSERIIREFSAHKIENSDKNKIISKKHTKQKLGFSPDWFDALYMRFVFEIKQKYYTRY